MVVTTFEAGGGAAAATVTVLVTVFVVPAGMT